MTSYVTNIKSEIRLFADDILLYKTATTPNDHNTLQNDLHCRFSNIMGKKLAYGM